MSDLQFASVFHVVFFESFSTSLKLNVTVIGYHTLKNITFVLDGSNAEEYCHLLRMPEEKDLAAEYCLMRETSKAYCEGEPPSVISLTV